jgi:hypothetical protein
VVGFDAGFVSEGARAQVPQATDGRGQIIRGVAEDFHKVFFRGADKIHQ